MNLYLNFNYYIKGFSLNIMTIIMIMIIIMILHIFFYYDYDYNYDITYFFFKKSDVNLLRMVLIMIVN